MARLLGVPTTLNRANTPSCCVSSWVFVFVLPESYSSSLVMTSICWPCTPPSAFT